MFFFYCFIFCSQAQLVACIFFLQFFDHVEEAVWAVEVLKTSSKTVAATLCISPYGDMHGVSPGECAVRLVKAGTTPFCDVVLQGGNNEIMF